MEQHGKNRQQLAPLVFKRGLCAILLLLYTGALCAQARMSPSEICTTKESRNYETALLDYFGIGGADKFAYLVKPSFAPEYCLSYNKREKTLILKRPTENIGYCFCNPFTELQADEWKLSISDTLADSLHRMFAAAVITSSYLAEEAGEDGTTYQFFLNPVFASMAAECWEPDANSNCGQAVAVVEKLCEAVRTNDRKKAEALIGEISDVTNLFRKHYPDNFQEERDFLWR